MLYRTVGILITCYIGLLVVFQFRIISYCSLPSRSNPACVHLKHYWLGEDCLGCIPLLVYCTVQVPLIVVEVLSV